MYTIHWTGRNFLFQPIKMTLWNYYHTQPAANRLLRYRIQLFYRPHNHCIWRKICRQTYVCASRKYLNCTRRRPRDWTPMWFSHRWSFVTILLRCHLASKLCQHVINDKISSHSKWRAPEAEKSKKYFYL